VIGDKIGVRFACTIKMKFKKLNSLFVSGSNPSVTARSPAPVGEFPQQQTVRVNSTEAVSGPDCYFHDIRRDGASS
jgi:hypothetical protein